ncbi:MAG: hypothetical protein JW963_12875 [Anaerolineales bacterium]|nr:hypothetical protein [Anaerolineales bacterium]
METNDLDRPASWRETLLALVPFLLFPLVFLLGAILTPFIENPPDPAFALGITFGVLGVLLIIMVAGWVKEFPRWVFPYWGFILLITLYMRNFTGTIFGYQVTGDWWAWAPVAGVAVVGSLLARGLRPVYRLLKSVWRGWTTLSFVFYGALPLLFIAAYDEVHNDGPILSLIMLILCAGTVFYMRTENTWHRFASLVGGFSLGWITLMIHQSIYWNGRQDDWMPGPGSWMETLKWTSQFGATLMLILVAPVLLGLLRWAITSRQTPKPA